MANNGGFNFASNLACTLANRTMSCGCFCTIAATSAISELVNCGLYNLPLFKYWSKPERSYISSCMGDRAADCSATRAINMLFMTERATRLFGLCAVLCCSDARQSCRSC
ncbi:hypothetical protein COLO4_17951 [Corchorus olitorius]|uniref:Uncharacterized protein n=1 Tax=Corchorus olitorius TaxID=93759 RepID=A0A1R3JB37_9ROSI|nr:hypothetical protein COLO4_17951 [Corchorus olitorius]